MLRSAAAVITISSFFSSSENNKSIESCLGFHKGYTACLPKKDMIYTKQKHLSKINGEFKVYLYHILLLAGVQKGQYYVFPSTAGSYS